MGHFFFRFGIFQAPVGDIRTKLLYFVLLSIMLLPIAVQAAEIEIEDAYVRSSSPVAVSGASFMKITNTGMLNDRLLAVETDIAELVEIHSNVESVEGILGMRSLDEGLEIPAGETIVLERGGTHIMLMGLAAPLESGEKISMKLMFENQGEIFIDVIVDQER